MAIISDTIKHVFVLMLENRSFDHLLGQSGIAGLNVPVPTDENADPDTGALIKAGPFPGDPVFQLNKVYKDPSHEFKNTLHQLTGMMVYVPGSAYPRDRIDNSGFISDYSENTGSAYPDTVMYGFKRDQLPVLNTLAREYAVCDCWFSSLPGPTVPNRLFVHAGTSGWLDDSPNGATLAWEVVADGIQFENGSIFDRIDGTSGNSRPVTWHVYKDGSFALVEQVGGVKKKVSQVHPLNELEGRLKTYGNSPTYNFIEPKYDLIGNYQNGNSQHPYGDVRAGEALIKSVYETIVASPVWLQSLLIVVYDEHGGFYDHVAPPAAIPPGDTKPDMIKRKNDFLFDQYGVRVPALFISPYIKKGTIIKAVPDKQFDHSSVVRTLCELWNLDGLTSRDKSARSILPELNTTDRPRTDCLTTLPDPNMPAGLADAIAQPESTSPGEFDGDSAAPVEGNLYIHLQIAMMDKVKDLPMSEAVAKAKEISNTINTKSDALSFISGVAGNIEARG